LSLKDYIKSITHFPLLSAQEEISLFQALKKKETEIITSSQKNILAQEITRIRNKIIKANLRLVVSMAQKISYSSHLDDIMDLIDEGNLGLMEAIDRFDPELGFKFSTYAFWWIRQHIKATIITQNSTLNASINFYHLAYRIKKFLRQTGKDYASIKEISEFIKIPEDKVKLALPLINKLVYLDEPLFADDNSKITRGDTIISSFNSIEEKEKEWIHDFINDFLENHVFPALNANEVFTLKNRYGINEFREPLTLKEVGDKINLTAERVRQLEKEALKKIRKMNIIYTLKELLS